MWEAYDLQNEDFLWAGIPFMGGIAGQQQAPCGAVTAMAIALGLRHRCSLTDKPQAKKNRNAARFLSSKLVQEFTQKFGDITCSGLIGMDFSKPGVYKQFREEGIARQKCEKYIQFIIARLYDFETASDGQGKVIA